MSLLDKFSTIFGPFQREVVAIKLSLIQPLAFELSSGSHEEILDSMDDCILAVVSD